MPPDRPFGNTRPRTNSGFTLTTSTIRTSLASATAQQGAAIRFYVIC